MVWIIQIQLYMLMCQCFEANIRKKWKNIQFKLDNINSNKLIDRSIILEVMN